MLKNNKYLILYYMSFILTSIFLYLKADICYELNNIFSFVLAVINLILVIIFSIFLFNKKINKYKILFPISYIVFLIILVIISFILNEKIVINDMHYPYVINDIHYPYYICFLLFEYLLLNVYSLLSFDGNKKQK